MNSETEILDNWRPEPLVPKISREANQHLLNPHIVSSKPGKYIIVDGIKCLNCATHNYLGLADNPRLEEMSLEATSKYGVGSCGPRGFYGTMDVHLKLEEELANFLGVQEAVLYSYGFSTIASAIPAYAKSSDIIFVDELCNFSIQQGIVASRAKVFKFRHNDVDHLRDLVEASTWDKNKRTFLVVEGIYAKTGSLCPLKQLVDIKKKHKIRLFIDESHSFGVLGASGKGITEHLDVNIEDIDMIMASLEYAFCSYGGFCAGSTYIIDHQRLAGAGYCFSASLPPLQVQVSLESLKIISECKELIENEQSICRYAHEKLKFLSVLKDISHPLSPIKVLTFKKEDTEGDEQILRDLCNEILKENQIALTVAEYLKDDSHVASIRLVISANLSTSDVDRVAGSIERFSRRFNKLLEVPDNRG